MADQQPIEADHQDCRKQAVQPLDYYVAPKPAPSVPVPLWMAPVVAGECLLLLIIIVFGVAALMDTRALLVVVCAVCATWLALGMHFGITKGSRAANYGLVVLLVCFSALGVGITLSGAWLNNLVPILFAVAALGMAIAHFRLAQEPADD